MRDRVREDGDNSSSPVTTGQPKLSVSVKRKREAVQQTRGRPGQEHRNETLGLLPTLLLLCKEVSAATLVPGMVRP